MAFATTVVVAGHGIGVVTDTGMNTKVGKIASLIISDDAPETPLQQKLRRSREKTGTCSIRNMFCNICNRPT